MLAVIQSMPRDGGPVYAETVLGRFPVEPWNTASNSIFLVVIVYWALRTRFRLQSHPITVTAIPVLFLGYIAGTLYHALRNNDLWRILDAGPIAFLGLLASTYLWYVILGGVFRAALVVVIPALLYRWVIGASSASQHGVIMWGYAFVATVILTPLVIHCINQRGRRAGVLILVGFFFSMAFLARQWDLPAVGYGFPMGSHFLWHLFGGVASFGMMDYLFHAEADSRKLAMTS